MKYFLLLFIASCSSVPEQYYKPVLVKQTLKPRIGFSGLTYRYCEKYNKEGCDKYTVENYDLNDSKVRKQLFDFRFICTVNGDRYKICQNEGGLCRQSFAGLFNRKEKVEKISISEIEYLVNGDTSCEAE